MAIRNGRTNVKPRLLIIINRFVIGGQAVDTLPLAYHLQDDFKILIVYGEKEKDEIEPEFLLKRFPGLEMIKLPYLRRSINPLIDIAAFFKLIFIIKNFKADIVHTHGAKSGILGRIAAFLCGVPVIIHTFHGHFFHSYFSKKVSGFICLLERAIGKITTSVVALSRQQKVELVEVFKILPSQKIKIIPLGFAGDKTGNLEASRSTFRKTYGLADHDVAIGIVGRVVPIKNHVFFLKVIQKILLSNENASVAFFIIGDGELRKNVEEWLTENSLSYNTSSVTAANKIVFTSWLTNIEEVMSGLDIVALTSLNEGTPLSIIEAQYYRRPVICTNVGGVKDTMDDGVTGYLINKDDVEGFTEKLKYLVRHKDVRDAFGKSGNALVEERFSKQKEVIQTKDFYFSLLSGKAKVSNKS